MDQLISSLFLNILSKLLWCKPLYDLVGQVGGKCWKIESPVRQGSEGVLRQVQLHQLRQWSVSQRLGELDKAVGRQVEPLQKGYEKQKKELKGKSEQTKKQKQIPALKKISS